MNLIFYTFLGLLGLAIGSFIGMLTYRLPRRLPISGLPDSANRWQAGRSFCDHCGKKIPLSENIPIISYLLLNGKCSRCKKTISPVYPLIEIGSASAFIWAFIVWNNLTSQNGIAYTLKENLGFFSLIACLLLLVILISLFIIDLTHQILPDSLIYILGVLVVLSILTLPSPQLFNHLLTALLAFSFFLAIYLATQKKGMGFGDVKLSFWLGLLLGYPETPVWIFLSFLLGAVVGIVLILAKKAHFKKPIPFGPFLIISAIVAFLFGEILFNIYLGI